MINLIPVADKYVRKDGEFAFDGDLTLKSDFDLPLLNFKKADNAELVIKKSADLPSQAYILDIDKERITVKSRDEAGAYYALQSLRQLSRYEIGKRRVDCCVVEDAPRFSWRGIQLDCSRHFWSVEQIKRILDMMFMVKLNVFHWHLTDDQGWRIEIKKYPKLTEIGSVRNYTQLNGWGSKETVNEKYGGYYTQEQIKEVVDYASKRFITVVPEVDFPAHSAAAIAAYPELACRVIDSEVPGYFGSLIPERVYGIKDWNRTLCVGKEFTKQFVFDIIDEVCELFPAPYFHIGGDEVPKDEWKKCPHCQKVIKGNALKNEDELQGRFNNKIFEYLKSKGKRLIGWNEISAAKGLDKSVIVQYWTPQRDKNAENHVNTGGNIIMSNHRAFYFDMPYAQYPLFNTYDYSPERFGVNSENVKNVLGVEGEVWTEWIDTQERLDMMLFPRMQALSEVAWSGADKRNWNDFKERLDSFKVYFKLFGFNYAVDKISQPKNTFSRIQIRKKFSKGDVHLEDKQNKIYMSKGEK